MSYAVVPATRELSDFFTAGGSLRWITDHARTRSGVFSIGYLARRAAARVLLHRLPSRRFAGYLHFIDDCGERTSQEGDSASLTPNPNAPLNRMQHDAAIHYLGLRLAPNGVEIPLGRFA